MLLVDLGLLITVDATQHKSGARADIALVFFRPLDNFEKAITLFNFVTSRIAFSTSQGVRAAISA